MASVGGYGVLPSSHASGVMTAQRKQILQLYKTKVGLPILQAHDGAEYDEAASKWLYAFQCSVRDFCPNRLVHGWNVLEVSFGHEEWAFIKLTGRCDGLFGTFLIWRVRRF